MPDARAWSARYDLGSIPWDLGRPHPELEERLADDPALGLPATGSALVPGAGTGHDAAALARSGWSVTAIDIAPAVEPTLRKRLAPHDASVVIGDALAHVPPEPVGLVFDHTFFCALEPSLRAEFASMVDRVLADHGALISIVFPLGKPSETGGPPWGISPADLDRVLGDGFEIVDLGEESRVGGRAWPHRWVRWERRSTA